MFILYLALMLGIGVYFFIKTKSGGEKDYFLGGRQMNSWVTALSAQASDMSAWLLMGLPGSIWAFGMGKVWIAIGLFIGTVLNWIYTAPRLREFSQIANDSITIPEYLSNRFLSKSNTLRILCAIVFFVCYAVYAASSFKACGAVLNNILGLDPSTTYTLYIAAAVIILYTFLGGFSAVCWTDFFQGMLMLGALLAAPIVALVAIENGETGVIANATVTSGYTTDPNFWNFLPSGKLDWTSISTILSGLAWGLGYFGMPHILVRFMAIKSTDMIKKSRVIAIVWVILAFAGSVGVALAGAVYFNSMDAQENIFINVASHLFPSVIAGILLSAIIAASMSTADSQLLVSSSSFTSDIYKTVIRKKASDKEMMNVGRIVVILISVVAVFIATNPNAGGIMDLVENAWAGFGSAFGPVIILSLCWKRFTYKGAVAGIIAGALTDVLWLMFLTDVTGVYELLPGFIISLIAAIVVTLIDKKPSAELEELFDKYKSTKI